MADASMSPAQFQKLRQIVYERSGIHFADAKQYVLESRLKRRLVELELESFDQYAMLLTIGPYRDDEFQEMFNRITINETSFFRNPPQLDVFEKVVLPKLLQARNDQRRLRIWSAACSTGEEPYTIAIQLYRTLGIRLADWSVEILGTDISGKALGSAQQGFFTKYAMRSIDPLVLKRYFTEVTGGYRIDPNIAKMVAFEQLNLKDRLAARRHGLWDVIFCRNVMIYFDQQMRADCLQMFNSALADDGTLFVGHSESIRDGQLFAARPEPQAFAYTKAGMGVKTNAA